MLSTNLHLRVNLTYLNDYSQRLIRLFVDTDAFQSCVKDIDSLLPMIAECIVSELGLQCSSHLRNVGDIPRLYRRTNKDAPTKCFAYVHQLLNPLMEFRSHHGDQSENLTYWTRGVLESLAKQ